MRTSSFPLRLLVPLALFLAPATVSAQSNWVTWVDETASRISGDPSRTTADTQEKDMVAGDFDRDGWDDLVIVRKVPFSNPGGRQNVLLMNENGVLTERTAQYIPSFQTPDDARDVLAFDANGDGWLDLVIATTFSQQPRMWINQGLDGNGNWLGFLEDTNWFSPAFNPGPKFCAVYDGDVDNDGDLDLFFSDYDSPLNDRLLINDGTGKFVDETSTRMSLAAADSIFGTGSFICDFNKDGWADILKGSGSFEPVKLLINDGAGSFFQIQTFNTDAAYMVRAADFNNDNRMDFYVVDDGQDYIYRNDSTKANGEIAVTKILVTNSMKTQGFGGNVHAADLNQDGYVDLGVADVDVDIAGCDRRFAALRNRRGQFGTDGLSDPNNSKTLPWNSQGVHDFAFLDINNDGRMDMVQGRCIGLRAWIMKPIPDLVGTPYCQAGLNTTGEQARIHGYGSASIANNQLRLVVEGGVRGQMGLFFYGSGQLQLPFGDGFLCVSGPHFRLKPPILVGGTDGLVAFDLDLTKPPASGGAGMITAGSTWNFQFWYRDPTGPSTFNATDATAITFIP